MEQVDSTLQMRMSLEERKEIFKQDQELMKETTKFVSEIITSAITEVSRRKFLNENTKTAGQGRRFSGADMIEGWNNRARGFCNRVLNVVFPCFSNNELLPWVQLRYRFNPRP